MRELTVPRDRIKTAAEQACRIHDLGPADSTRFVDRVASRILLFAPQCHCAARFRHRICTTIVLVRSAARSAATDLPSTTQPDIVETFTNLVRADAGRCCCLLEDRPVA